jgi:NAD+ diphosphatase
MIHRPNFYAESGLDRAGGLRTDVTWLEARLHDPRTRLVPVWRSQNLFRVTADDRPAPLLPAASALEGLLNGETHLVLLGLAEDAAHFAIDLSHLEDAAAAGARLGGEFADLRRHGPLLDHRSGAILAYARGILHWHARHRFCGVCGAATKSAHAGHVRQCTNVACQTQHFPRTDPAVIMLVTDGERCLLGRQRSWPPGLHSTLAGFVEPGESLEEAVAREVLEETGVRVHNVRYHSSQPWPFPASIMLGFDAEAAASALRVNRDELEDARWFHRAELLASTEDERFRLPRRDSIARRLVESWLGRE